MFFDTRREIHNLSMLAFSSAPNHVRPPPQTTGLISANPESQPSSSDAKTQLTDISQIPAHASGAWRHSHLLVSFSIWGLFWHLWMTHPPPRAWTPALMLYLTNPCAKRKVLSLTKPKGKIYKAKSLGHYITIIWLHTIIRLWVFLFKNDNLYTFIWFQATNAY